MTSPDLVMRGSYDYGLVVLSVLLSVLAAYAAIELSGRVAAARGKARLVWLIGGATASGIGVWSMHFTGMRAFSLPVPVQYGWPTVLLSLLPACFGFAVALFLMSRQKLGWLQTLAGGVLVGGGITALHYTAMASMRLSGMRHYSPPLAILSLVLAILFSVLPLRLIFVHSDTKAGRRLARLASALLLGAANPVMHYTAMAATTFTRSQVVPDLSHAVFISTIGLRVFTIIPLIVLTVALAISLVDRLEKHRLLLDELFEQAPQAVALADADCRIIRVNSEFTRIFGYPNGEAVGRRINELIVSDELQNEFRKYEELTRQGQRVEVETDHRRKDGSSLHVSIVRIPVSIPGGQTASYAIYRDITERKRADDALRGSEQKFRQLAENISEVFWIADEAADRILYVSPVYEQVWGRTCESLYQNRRSWLEAVHPDDRDRLLSAQQNRVHNQVPINQEYRIVRPDGSVRWIWARRFPVRDGCGRVYRSVGVAEDVTERKRAEEQIRFQASILEQVRNAVIVADLQGIVIYWNEYAETLYGWKAEEVLGRNAWQLLVHPDSIKHLQEIRKSLEAGERWEGELIGLRKTGTSLPVYAVIASIRDSGQRVIGFVGVGIDITERKESERVLRSLLRASERLNSTLDINDLLNSLAEEARKLTDAELAWSGVRTDVGMVCHALISGESTQVPFEYAWPPGFGWPGWVLTHKTPYMTNDAASDPVMVPEIRERWGVKSGIDVPILDNQGEVIGFLEVNNKRDEAGFTEADLKKMVAMAGTASIALQNALTFRKLREEETGLRNFLDLLRNFAAEQQRVREDERGRVAREIHDELGQAMTAIKIGLTSLIPALTQDGQLQSEKIRSLVQLADQAIQSVRRIATNLRPSILDHLGLSPALEWAAEEFELRTGIKCRLDLPELDVVVDNERATALFRIFQEALTNVARHANATVVRARIAREDTILTLEVHDNGQGFDDNQLSGRRSLGILGMQERAVILGGAFTITNTPGKGTTVKVRIPEAHR